MFRKQCLNQIAWNHWVPTVYVFGVTLFVSENLVSVRNFLLHTEVDLAYKEQSAANIKLQGLVQWIYIMNSVSLKLLEVALWVHLPGRFGEGRWETSELTLDPL